MMTEEQVLVGSHDYRLVVLSIVISILSAYAARDLSERIRDAHGLAWLGWLAGGATAHGIGTWSMHYTGMLAFSLPLPILYDWPTVGLSLAVGILGSAAALFVLSRNTIRWPWVLAASIFLGGVGISGLHYTAMMAMQVQAEQHDDGMFATLAIVLAIVLSWMSLALMFLVKSDAPHRRVRNHAIALLRGVANPAMHYTAMAALIFTFTNAAPNLAHAVSIVPIGVLGISIVPVMVLVATLLTALAGRLQKQQEIFQTIFDHIPIMIRFLGPDNRVQLVNRAWERTLGWTLEETQQYNLALFEQLYPDSQERARALQFVAAATGEWADFTIHVRDGRVLDMTFANIRLSDGTNLSIGQDITARKRAEEHIQFQARALAQVHDAVIAVDNEERITYWNASAEQVYGFTADEVQGQLLSDVNQYRWVNPQDEQAAYDSLAASGAWHGENIHRTKSGKDISVESSVSTLMDERGVTVGLLAVIRDITARKQAEAERARLFAQLQLLSRQLLQAQEAERRSIARELHDEIGQRLTGLGLLFSNQHPSPDQLTDAQAVVRDLIARLRNLSLDLRPTILDDLGLLPALVWLFERYTAQTSVAARFEHRLRDDQRFDPEVETTAYRIIQEALTNVARHAGVKDVTVRLWTDADTLWVVVADQGRGFDPQAIDPHASSGLTGMRERTALLGGSVTIEAARGGGTRVTASLPLTSGESQAQEPES